MPYDLPGPQVADLADNIGMARLWDGVHWPSDHVAGAALGEQVGYAVLQQIADVPLAPDRRTAIPSRQELRDELAAAV